MFSAFYDAKLRFCRDERQRLEHLGNRSKGVVFTVYKKGRNYQSVEVGGSPFIGLFWRMKRIRKQQECSADVGMFRCQDAGLTAAVGMAAEENPAGYLAANSETAVCKPFRSSAERPGKGGPKLLIRRNGRSKRSTRRPAAANAFAKASSSGEAQLPPAP